MAVKVCKKCGEYNSESSIICYKCGELLNNTEVRDAGRTVDYNSQIECPNCGEMIKCGSIVCPECREIITKKINKTSNIIYKHDEEYSGIALYIFSILVPIVAFIVGAIMLTKDDEYKRSIGAMCIVLDIISIILASIIIYFYI